MKKTLTLFALLLATSSHAIDAIDFWLMRSTACYSTAAITAIPDLLASWSFDGNTTSYPAGYDLIPVGGVSYTNGVYGQAIMFDDTFSRYATNRTIMASLNIDRARTICYWVKQYDNLAAVRPRISWRSGSNAGALVFRQGNQNYWYSYTAGGNNAWIFCTEDATNTWMHVALVQQPVQPIRSAYTNGVLCGTNMTGGTLTSTSSFHVGKDTQSALWMIGEMEDLRIYDRALSAAEILRVKNGEPVQ